MADALLSNTSRDMWSEVRKVKGRNSMMVCTIDDMSDSVSIASMFSNKYNMLFNSDSYDTNEMKTIEDEVMARVHYSNSGSYYIYVHGVTNAIAHCKNMDI